MEQPSEIKLANENTMRSLRKIKMTMKVIVEKDQNEKKHED